MSHEILPQEIFTLLPRNDRDAEALRSKNPLESSLSEYIASFGIDVGSTTLPKEHIMIFYLARKLDKTIQEFTTPIANTNIFADTTNLKRQKMDEEQPQSTSTIEQTVSNTPQNTGDIDTIKSVRDLPLVLPSDLIWSSVSPELFSYYIATRKLRMPLWLEPDTTPEKGDSLGNKAKPEEVHAPISDENLQHSYCILDVSSSMTRANDGRDLIARALTLAFLHNGHRQGSLLAVRPFALSPYELSKGRSPEEFKTIAQKVLTISMNKVGGTNINAAFQQANLDFFHDPDFKSADMLLITDGEAKVSFQPLSRIRLHTFLLGDTADNTTLKEWSETYKRLKLAELPEDLLPSPEEIDEARDMINLATSKVHEITGENFESAKNTVEYLGNLLDTLQWLGASGLEQEKQGIAQLRKVLGSKRKTNKLLKDNEKNQQKRGQEEQAIVPHAQEATAASVQETAKINEILEEFRKIRQAIDPNFDFESTYGKQETSDQKRQRVDMNRSKVRILGKIGKAQLNESPRYKLMERLAVLLEKWLLKHGFVSNSKKE